MTQSWSDTMHVTDRQTDRNVVAHAEFCTGVTR